MFSRLWRVAFRFNRKNEKSYCPPLIIFDIGLLKCLTADVLVQQILTSVHFETQTENMIFTPLRFYNILV